MVGNLATKGLSEMAFRNYLNQYLSSGITLDKVVHEINIREIHYRLIKIGFRLGAMATLFKERFTNYEETVLNDATKLNISVSDMIIREIFNDVEY